LSKLAHSEVQPDYVLERLDELLPDGANGPDMLE
jgi:hypothetical protein